MTALNRPHALRAVLFDFDGTLMDASEAICASFRVALQSHGLAPTDQQIRALIGQPLRDMFLSVLPSSSDDQLDILISAYRDAFFPLADEKTVPLPGALQLVRRLRGTHVLGLVTTRSSGGAIRMLRHQGILDAFDAVVALDHVTHPKPHPEPVLTALEQLSVASEEAVMVGDTPDDILAGKAAGVWTCGVTTGSHSREALQETGADIVVDSLGELGDWIDVK